VKATEKCRLISQDFAQYFVYFRQKSEDAAHDIIRHLFTGDFDMGHRMRMDQ
jgi:hypothetical protein